MSLLLAAAYPTAASADHTCVEVSGDLVTTEPSLGDCPFSNTPGHTCQTVKSNGIYVRVVVCVDHPVV